MKRRDPNGQRDSDVAQERRGAGQAITQGKWQVLTEGEGSSPFQVAPEGLEGNMQQHTLDRDARETRW